MLDILARLIEFFFSFILKKIHNFTYSMVEAKVGDHGCDIWIVFKHVSTFIAPIVMDLSILLMDIMSSFDIVLLLIFDWMT